jgi:hypothetical protein
MAALHCCSPSRCVKQSRSNARPRLHGPAYGCRPLCKHNRRAVPAQAAAAPEPAAPEPAAPEPASPGLLQKAFAAVASIFSQLGADAYVVILLRFGLLLALVVCVLKATMFLFPQLVSTNGSNILLHHIHC